MNESFSKRLGLEPEPVLQFESMNATLKDSLWNILHLFFWSRREREALDPWGSPGLTEVLRVLWVDHFKTRLDEVRWTDWGHVTNHLKSRYGEYKWNQVYDLVQFMAPLADHIEGKSTTEYIAEVNRVLSNECAAYRFVDQQIVPISNEVEVAAINTALSNSPDVVRRHLKAAIAAFANRTEPDLANCVRESIQAVEAAAKLLANDPNGTLGTAVKKLDLHPAFRQAIERLYGYASNADFRHVSLTHSSEDVSMDHARFVLVICSAIANYLLSLTAAQQAE